MNVERSYDDVLQLLLERKINEVEKLVKETEEKIADLAENISQAKVSSPPKAPDCVTVLCSL